MKLGVDIDGVLADFNTGFIQRVIAVTGRDLFPARPFEIPTWNYPEHYGYTADDTTAIWASIKADPLFWYKLPDYSDTTAALSYLADRVAHHEDDLYFITARPGHQAKGQTEDWLRARLPSYVTPTVLITSHKGLAAQTLGLDVYIDDRWENALQVAQTKCRSLLYDRPWNRDQPDAANGITRVWSAVGMADISHEIGHVGTFEGTSRLNESADLAKT